MLFSKQFLRERGVRQKHILFTAALSLLLCVIVISYLALGPGSLTLGASRAVQFKTGDLPLAFVPNQGQTSSEVKFQVHDLNGTVFLTASDMVFNLAGKGLTSPALIQISHQGTQSDVAVSGLAPLPGRVSYLIGADSARWHTELPTYSSVIYRDLYPGIDLQYEGSQGVFESIYYVRPGSDPSNIRWSHTGQSEARINAGTGAIELFHQDPARPLLIEEAPVAWQEMDGQKVLVPVSFKELADGSYTFALAAYDRAKTLIIDPTLVYSSYFGGSSLDYAEAIALDSGGNIYVAGSSNSTNFPVADAMQDTAGGWEDVFVMKMSPGGDSVIYSTYLGGDDDDIVIDLAVDSGGSVYLSGTTISSDFPTHNGYKNSCVGGMCVGDAFLARLNVDGSDLMYSTYLGGSKPDDASGVAVDDSGHAYLTGSTFSTDFPHPSAYQSSIGGPVDAYVAHINTGASGTASLVWATYLGGSAPDYGVDIVLAEPQRLVITGETTSSNFPKVNALQSTYGGSQDIFLTSMNTAGSAVQFSTLLGGSGKDYVYDIAANSLGSVYVIGNTLSTNFPTASAIQSTAGGDGDVFITGINAAGSSWLFSTYMGGSKPDYGYGIDVDSAGGIYITGATQSTNFPVEQPLQAYTGNTDAFVAKLQPDGSAIVYSTYLGGSDSDYGNGIAASGAVSYVAGNTFSTNFPVQDAQYPTISGNGDAFVAIIEDAGAPPPIDDPTEPDQPEYPKYIPSVDPLGGSSKIASTMRLATGDELTFTILLNNSSLNAVPVNVVDKLPAELDYIAGSASHGGVYDAGQRTVTWTGVEVPASGEVQLTLAVTTSLTKIKAVTNIATITSGDVNFDVATGILVGFEKPPADETRPKVESVAIGSQDILTSPDVTLAIQATDNTGVEKMFIREWQVSNNPTGHWEVVKSSGWVDYQTSYAWTLDDQSGVHYLGVWVADDEGNVSIFNRQSMDYASLLLPDTEVKALDLIPYLVHFEAGTAVTATLTPSAGNVDMFVWFPQNGLLPDKFGENTGTTPEVISFTAPEDGTYLFLVYARTDATYTLSITMPSNPAGGSSPGSPGFTKEPLLSKIGFDPIATGDLDISSPFDHNIYLPAVRR